MEYEKEQMKKIFNETPEEVLKRELFWKDHPPHKDFTTINYCRSCGKPSSDHVCKNCGYESLNI